MKNNIKELTLRELQKEETKLLKKVVDLCDKNNLKYYLAGGTLLGAIRHKGFIPWDDDIDIIMPRPDLEKLEDIMKSKNYMLDKNTKFASCRLKNCNHTILKVYDTRIKVDINEKNKDERYMWIDIFPIDGFPESKIITNIHCYKAVMLRKLLRIVNHVRDNEKWNIKKIIKECVKNIIRYIFKNKESFLTEALEKNAKKYDFDKSKYVGVVTFGWGPQEKMVRSEMSDVEVEFEGFKFNAMGCYDKYLTNLYGDYMKLPPESKRKTHIQKAIKIEG